MKISHHIDWITATRKFAPHELDDLGSLRDTYWTAFQEFTALDGDRQWVLERVPQQRFYDYAFRDKNTGVVLNIAEGGNNKGLLIVYSGKSLSRGQKGERVIQSLLGLNYKITRLDVAFDVIDSGYDTMAIADKYEREVGVRGKNTYSVISSAHGSTLYVGSRRSPKMVRVYDKGKETKTDLDWLRLEIEFKQYAADQMAVQCFDDMRSAEIELQGILNCQDHPVLVALNNYCKGGMVAEIKRPVPNSDRAAWLINQVLPAFKTMFRDEPINAVNVWTMFENALKPMVDRIEGDDVDNQVD